MSFVSTVNGATVVETTPVGTIAAYLGTTDPDGWVICDGASRSNSTKKYDRLIGKSIGTFTASNASYTPPNLKSRFLYGSSIITSTMGIGGAATDSITLSTANMPSHSHGVNDPGHGHNWSYGTSTDDAGTGGSDREFTKTAASNSFTNPIASGVTNITIQNAGSGTAFTVDTVPPYVRVNYIMKL